MLNGIVKEVKEVKKSGKETYYEVYLQDGTKMTTFDPRIKPAGAGDSLGFEIQVNGKFNNLKDGWKLARGMDTAAELAKPEGGKSVTDECRVRSMAFAYSKDLVVAGIIQLQDLYNAAQDFENYLIGVHKPGHKEDWYVKYFRGESGRNL
jgi:hypothetical protein